MIYVFDCFPWILRFNIGPARENRDRVYVTDAKCPHQGGFRNRGNNHFDHLQKMDFLIKGEENIGKFIWYIYMYIYRKMMRNDGKMMGSRVCPLYRFTYINIDSAYIGLLKGWWKLAPMEGSWQFGLRLIMVGYRSILMARHRLVTWSNDVRSSMNWVV